MLKCLIRSMDFVFLGFRFVGYLCERVCVIKICNFEFVESCACVFVCEIE